MAWFIQKLNGRYAAVFVSGVPGMEVEEAVRAEDELNALRAQLAASQQETRDALEVVDAAKELMCDLNLLRSMDGHEDDGGRLCCNGCDYVWGEGHADGCRVGNLFDALAA